MISREVCNIGRPIVTVVVDDYVHHQIHISLVKLRRELDEVTSVSKVGVQGVEVGLPVAVVRA
jgi:hypothetical protein